MAIALDKMPQWPAAMDWKTTLAYAGLGETTLRELVRAGRLRFLPIGPNGKRVAPKAQVDQILTDIFTSDAPSVEEDFDFGNE